MAQHRCVHCAAVAAKAAAPVVIPATQWLISIGVFILCGCASIFFLAWSVLAWVRHTATSVVHGAYAITDCKKPGFLPM